MHIPDGLIQMNYPLIICTIIVIAILIFVFYKLMGSINEKKMPLIALFIVVAVLVQMVELPLPVAACVHVSLITLIALYDFKSSIIIYMFVTIIQSLFIGEGGISVLGLNLLNLALLAPIFARGIYDIFSKINKYLAIFISGFGTITLLGIVVSIEYAIAGVYPIGASIVTIIPVEMLVGVLEGVVTLVLVKALKNTKPELVPYI